MKRKLDLTAVLFVIYSILLLWVVLFKLSFSIDDIRSLAGERSFNLIPFYYDNEVNVRFHMKEVMLNFVIFAPFGFYLKMLDAPTVRAFVCGLLTCISLEIIQFTSTIGAFDVTDIITNTAGCIIGVCACLLAIKLFKNKKRLYKTVNMLMLVALSLFAILAAVLIIANK